MKSSSKKERSRRDNLIGIANLAIEVARRELATKHHRKALKEAYNRWKNVHEVEHVERDTLDWTRMMFATKKEFEVVKQAKKDEYNARRRLFSAIRRVGLWETVQ